MAVFDKPGALVKVPVGSYGKASVCLKKGETEAHLDGREQSAVERIAINERRPLVLPAGGPLTNMVSVSRHGRELSLDYRLIGAHGESYQISGARRQPEFAVYKGDRKIASGKFEFG